MTRKEIMPGVNLTYVQAKKFKTNYMSVQLSRPMERRSAAYNALLPSVLRRGTSRYPDMQSFSRALDLLYGARVSDVVRKKGETQCAGFAASCIDDAFAPEGGGHLLESTADILGDLICSPATRNGRFIQSYVDSEKVNLIDDIRSVINDKRSYAAYRLLEEMCAGEPYGIPRLGFEKDAESVNATKLYRHYIETTAKAGVELFYCGSADILRVEEAYLSALSALPRGGAGENFGALPHEPRAEPRVVTEEMDVTQGKLSMGFSCESQDYPALLLANMIFGGSSMSKLFLNVREKLSLCYYASSVLHRQKNIITMSSGIEAENYQRAYDEILSQLGKVASGDFEDWEIDGARENMLRTLRALDDSPAAMEDFYLGQAVTGMFDTPETMAEDIAAVDRDRICSAACGIKLDTVYFLRGASSAKGEDAEEEPTEEEDGK